MGGREVRHLLHGDLTPRNIRLTANGVYILDFGISKALSVSRKVTRNDFGNIAYLSPERLETGEMDATDGFWSVGVMLYEMLRGEKPHPTADARRLEQLILSRQPPEPLDAGCPEGLRAIVGKLLAPAAAARYDSAQAIREDLERYAAGQPTQAQAEGWPACARRRPAGHPADARAAGRAETTRVVPWPRAVSARRTCAGRCLDSAPSPVRSRVHRHAADDRRPDRATRSRVYRGAGRVGAAPCRAQRDRRPAGVCGAGTTRCPRAATCASACGGWRASWRTGPRRWPIA